MSAQNSKSVGVLGAIAGLIGFSALAGVLVTAMVTPALAVTSMTAKSTVSVFDELPDYLTINQQSQRNTLYGLKQGEQIPFAQVFHQNREEVGWDAVSQFVKDATIAAEDERFYEHGGVDIAGIVRAAVNNVTSDTTQGASTLSQQLVKNLLIMEALNLPTEAEQDEAYAAAIDNSIDRKLREAKLAIGLEKRYTKQEILLGYLNIAGFGGNTYGIESAAQQYYSTSAADLTLAQAASLMAIVQQPTLRNPGDPENWERNQNRRDAILGNMLELDMVTQEQYDEAIATPVDETTVLLSAPKNGCLYASAAKFFCDYVLENVENLSALGGSPEERAENWKKGGYDVYTTIDLDQQGHAEVQLATYAPPTETRFQLGAATSTIQVGTGQIRVMAQNKNYNNTVNADPTGTSVNFNTDQENGASTGFQSGSAYKLFTLVNWLQNGHGLREVVDGSPRTYTLPADCYGSKPYLFKNDRNSNPGRINILRATAGSVNAAFANMASKLDLCDIRDTAISMGMHRADGGELGVNPTMILGTDEVAPLTVANAYATVASGGILCQPIAVDKIIAPDGTELAGQAQDCSQVISPEVAAAASEALEGVMAGGTGSQANPYDGTPLIGKTGTADAVHTFLVAASTKLSTATWAGNIVGDQDLRKISIGGLNGGSLRFAIMRPILAALNASPHGVGATAFPDPPQSLVRGQSQAVPNVAGQSLDQAEALIESLGLNFRDGGTVPSELPVGRVVSTNPGAGTLVSKGTTIQVMTSDGTLAATMPNVVNQQQDVAVAALAAAGFDPAAVSIAYVAGDPETVCTVTASDPAAGTATSTAATITLTVNRGDDEEEEPDCA